VVMREGEKKKKEDKSQRLKKHGLLQPAGKAKESWIWKSGSVKQTIAQAIKGVAWGRAKKRSDKGKRNGDAYSSFP